MQNILRENPVPTDYARRHNDVESPARAWRLINNDFILEHIRKYNIDEAFRQTKNEKFTFSTENLETFIDIVYARGVSGKSHLLMHEVWSKNWRIALC